MSSSTLNLYLKQIRAGGFRQIISNRQFKNIFYSIVFRFGALASNFLIVPLIIGQFSELEYGLIVTILSISTWFSFIDFGLANGLKNKISESQANNDLLKIRKYVSTSYFTLFTFVAILSVLLLAVNYFVDWNTLIKGPAALSSQVNFLIVSGLFLFFVRMVVELLNPILLAFHKTASSSFISFVSQLAILGLCGVFRLVGDRSLVHYGLAFFWVPLVVTLGFSIYFYFTSFRHIVPSTGFIEKKLQTELLKLGGNFFVIQIAVMIIFTTDNLIVGRIFGYEEVGKYNIAFRYFNIPLMLLGIVLTPYWPIFSEWYVSRNFGGIKKVMRRLMYMWGAFVLVCLLMLLLANFVYEIWVGAEVVIPLEMSIGMFLFSVISGWNNVFATFINSTNKLRLQLYSCIITGCLNIPVSIYFARHTGLGASGAIFGTSACLIVGSLWAPIQYYKLANNKAKGVWNK